MKKENKMLLKYGFKLFVLGYKITFSKKHLENMIKRRVDKNRPLCDKRLISAKRRYEKYNELWIENENNFLKLKA